MARRLAVSQSVPDKKEVKKPQIRMDDEILTEVLGKAFGKIYYIPNDKKVSLRVHRKRLLYAKLCTLFFFFSGMYFVNRTLIGYKQRVPFTIALYHISTNCS